MVDPIEGLRLHANRANAIPYPQEIQHAYHTNALLIKMLLSQAQANGMELLVDTNALENEFLLKQIAASELTALSRPASDFVRRNTQLGRIGAVTTISVEDPKASKVGVLNPLIRAYCSISNSIFRVGRSCSAYEHLKCPPSEPR